MNMSRAARTVGGCGMQVGRLSWAGGPWGLPPVKGSFPNLQKSGGSEMALPHECHLGDHNMPTLQNVCEV